MEILKKNLGNDFLASFVVFLVALPLCMGIALASGVPPILGIISGAIGGIVVGSITGSPIQVSGPAAGLAVMVFEVVQKQGMAALAIILVIAGLFQIISSIIKLGPLFRAISPAVIKGMLAGIGVLILCSQFHVMLDDLPRSSGVQNLITIPAAMLSIFDWSSGVQHVYAAGIGILTIAVIIIWNIIRTKINSKLPAPLLAIVVAVAVSYFAGLPIKTVDVPTDLFGSLQEYFIWNQTFTWDWNYLLEGIAMGFIATTETLLCVTAIDQVTGMRSKYNKELFAQGIGNTLAGLLGVLPITGVIVRSSANAEAGGKTKVSTIFHGVLLIVSLWFFPGVLALIPTSALAAILVYIGYKLVKVADMKNLFSFEKTELGIYLATIIGIVTINLLYGVLIGFGLAILKLLWQLHQVQIDEIISEDGKKYNVKIKGSASFLTIPKIAEALESIPNEAEEIVLDFYNVFYMDHAIQELITDWERGHNSTIIIDFHDDKKGFRKTSQMLNLETIKT